MGVNLQFFGSCTEFGAFKAFVCLPAECRNIFERFESSPAECRSIFGLSKIVLQSAGTLSSRRKSPSLLQESFFYSTVPSLFPSRWLSLNSQIADTKPSNSSTIIDLLVFSITIIFESTKGLNNRSAQRLPFRFLSLPWCSMLLCAVLYHIATTLTDSCAQLLSPVLRNGFP